MEVDTPARSLVIALSFFTVAAVSIGVTVLNKREAAQVDALVVQETLAGGPTGVRTWEVFAGREGAVCGSTTAPATVPRDFVAVWPDVFRVEDGSETFRRLWRRRCAPVLETGGRDYVAKK